MKKFLVVFVLFFVLSFTVWAADYDLWTTSMTNYNAPSPYIVTNSSQNGALNGGFQVFNRSSNGTACGGDCWQTTGAPSVAVPQWIQLDLGSGNASALSKYDVVRYNSVNYRPVNWTVWGSNDTLNYYLLHTEVSHVWGVSDFNDTFMVNSSSTNKYRYFRFNFTERSGTGALMLVGRIDLYFNTTAGGGSGVTTPTWVAPTPANGASNNTQIVLNASCLGNNAYIYFDNTTAPTTLVVQNSSLGNYSTNVVFEQRYYYVASCYNATSLSFSSNTSLQNWTYDLTQPSITLQAGNGWNILNYSNEDQYDNNLSVNISIADNIQVFGFLLNITKGGVVYFNETLTNLTGLTYNYNRTLNTTVWPAGVYDIFIQASDAHTERNISDYEVSKKDSVLDFFVENGNKLSVSSLDSAKTDTKKDKDRYSFEFDFTDTSVKDRSFIVQSRDCPLEYISSSKYAGHFVAHCGVVGNWIDFEGVGKKPVIEKISDYSYKVTFKNLNSKVKFNSVGGLNQHNVTYSWFRGNYTFNSDAALKSEPSVLVLNMSKNDSLGIVGVFVYNGSQVTINSTNTSSYKDFVYSFTASSTAGTFNFSWLVNVSQLWGYNYSLNISGQQLVTTFNVDNCTLSSNKTITFNVFNESTPSIRLNASWEVEFVFWATSRNNSENFTTVVGNAENISFCISPVNATLYSDIYVRYTVPNGFTHRWYLFNQTLTGTNTNVSIFNFDTTAGTSDMRITTRYGGNYSYFPNVIVYLQRNFIGENVWRTVQMDRSGDFGLTFFNIIEESVDYRLLFKNANNQLLDNTDSLAFSCVSGICDLTILLNPFVVQTTTGSLVSSISYSNVSQNVTVAWNTDDGSTSTVDIYAIKFQGATRVVICNTTQVGVGGTFYCSLAGYEGEVFVVVDRDGVRAQSAFIQVGTLKIGDVLSVTDRAFWGFIIVLIVFITGMFSPVGGVIAVFVGSLFNYFLGLLPEITIPALFVLGAVSIYLSLKMRT